MFWCFLSFLLLPLCKTKRWRAGGTFSIQGITEVLVEVTLPQQRALQKQVFFAQMAKTLISKSNLEVLAFLLEIIQGTPYLRSFVFGRLVFLVISVFFSRKVCFFYSQRFVQIQLSTRKKLGKSDSVVRHLHPSLMRWIFYH